MYQVPVSSTGNTVIKENGAKYLPLRSLYSSGSEQLERQRRKVKKNTHSVFR